MDLDGSDSPAWSPVSPVDRSTSPVPTRGPSRPHYSRQLPMPRPPTMALANAPRFHGDGLDLRTPVFSTPDVIDLTDDDAGPPTAPAPQQTSRLNRYSARPPRFGREIIDVEEEDSQDSSEIQFVSSRPRSRNENPIVRNGRHAQDENEVEFVSENPVSDEQRRLGQLMALLEEPEIRNRARHIRERVVQQREGARAAARRRNDLEFARIIGAARRPTQRRMGLPVGALRGEEQPHMMFTFRAPNLNFRAAAFDMGYEQAEEDPAPAPTYSAPPAAPEGFTRSPQEEEEVLVCPNCEDELCVGSSEQKRQVWLVKGCGHVSSSLVPSHNTLILMNIGLLRRVHGKPTHQEECQGQRQTSTTPHQTLQRVCGRWLREESI